MKYTFKPFAHADTQQLSQLMRHYLSGHEALRTFYKYTPDLKGLQQALTEMQWPLELRRSLSSAMAAQAARTTNTSELTLEHITALAQANTYTVTTGHQLCVFSGPVFFIYKIASVIHVCKQLQALHPDKKFVPVFWMASEDHDLPEANHFFTTEKKYTWNTAQTGPLGRMSTAGLTDLAAELQHDWQATSYDDWLKALFKAAYTQHATMADATRYLVNALFGNEGVVVFDGDDVQLKQLLKPVMQKDLLEQVPYKAVAASVKELEQGGYSAQVQPRPTNFFLLTAQQRIRIDAEGEAFVLQDGSARFSRTEMADLIEHHPEQLSPNVVLRPVYQQLVLPNLAYIGGPGELAYWLEFKAMFETLRVHFPVLVPRAFMTVVPERLEARMNKMHLTLAEGFKQPAAVLLQLQKQAGTHIALSNEMADGKTNVVLRPVYQQLVLPNLAYIGGPGELAYWLEFKAMFETLRVHFPVLVPRAFMTVVPERLEARMNKMHLTLAEGFKQPAAVLLQLQKQAGTHIALSNEMADGKTMFERLKVLAAGTDPTLVAHIEAREVHLTKTLQAIENKLNTAIRRKMETEQNWLQQMHACYLPEETPQERHLNFSVFVREYGPKWIPSIIENANPLENAHVFVVVGNG